MKASSRARRRQRHYQRMHKGGGLNLVSMMDIFTILVFFLMINSSDVKVVDQTPDIHLPKSVADNRPVDTLKLEITNGDIILQGRSVARLRDIATGDKDIAGLRRALAHQRDRRGGGLPKAGLAITILADRSTPYALLKRIMQTCVDADYRQVKLAVIRREDQPGHG